VKIVADVRAPARFDSCLIWLMNKSVLIVEDDPVLQNILWSQLALSGYTPHLACSGEDALAIAAAEPPAAILLDVGLPGMSGFDTLDRLQANQKTRDIKVIMLTGQDTDADMTRGYQAGCFYYLPKPHRLSDLLRGLAMATK
jgi:DNA-binding response OmpR family regulator